jgi:stearoyl-CoA desaturase (delta-9 desaturase)
LYLQKFPLNSGRIRFLLYALGPVFILVSHLGCLLLLVTGLSLTAAGWALALYLIRMLATTAIYHRLITHGSYRAPRLVHWIGSVVGASAGQMGPSWWKAHHLAHHRHVDTDLDPHSPAIMGWKNVQLNNVMLYRRCAADPDTVGRYAKDIGADRLDRWFFDRSLLGLAIGIAIVVTLLGPVYGAVASVFHTACYLQLSSAVNAIGHHFGRRPFENSATNLQWLAFLTAGEGLHNNHHAAPTSATFRLHRGEIDPGWWVIWSLKIMGLAKVRLDRTVFGRRKPRSPQPA